MRKLLLALCLLGAASGSVVHAQAVAGPEFTVTLSEPGPEGIPPEFTSWKADIQFEQPIGLPAGAADREGALPDFIFGQGLCPPSSECAFILRVHMGLDNNTTPKWQFIQFALERSDNHKRIEGFAYGELDDDQKPFRFFRRTGDTWQEFKAAAPEYREYAKFSGAVWDYVQERVVQLQRQKK